MADGEKNSRAAAVGRIREIHRISLAEILTKDGGYDHKTYLEELETLKKRPHSFEWYEAVAMNCVIGDKRHRKLDSMLNKLHYRRRLNYDLQSYTDFEQRLREFVHPRPFKTPEFVRTLFSDLEHDGIWKSVESHLAALQGIGYEVFLNSGTLLGVVRDKSLIEHDDDIDLAIILKATTAENAALEWNALKTKLADQGLLHRITDKNPAIYKLTPANGVNVDLFPAWQSDGKFFVFPHTHGALDITDVLPLRPCAVTGHPIPAQPEKMLVQNYGADWKTPDPHFEFPWVRAKEKFSPFLERVG